MDFVRDVQAAGNSGFGQAVHMKDMGHPRLGEGDAGRNHVALVTQFCRQLEPNDLRDAAFWFGAAWDVEFRAAKCQQELCCQSWAKDAVERFNVRRWRRV